jgi:hypothetical protein
LPDERRFVMKIIVIRTFRDKHNPDRIYAPGVIVSDLDEARARDIVLRGLGAFVKEESVKADEPDAGDGEDFEVSEVSKVSKEGEGSGEAGGGDLQSIDLAQQHLKVIAAVKAFADVERLKGYLAEENASVKPRASVVDAMKERIVELSDDVSF